MPVNFPPIPLYPEALDSDYNLFKVYNTVQTVITSNNPAWSSEIEIQPVPSSSLEIWAENGFATISGEILYYDSVEKNNDERVIKLKNCIRNLGGEATQFNSAGTEIMSFVLAEHHNQIAETIINIEQLLGGVECDDSNTLACCLDELNVPDCEEDGGCVEVTFDYTVDNQDDCEGTILSYQLNLQGDYDYFRLDFGDGTFTTIPENGTKTYAPGTTIDPVVTVRNELCETTVTGVERAEFDEPEPENPEEDIVIPIISCGIPDINLPEIQLPTPDISIPPIVLPGLDIEPISVGPISIGDINVPSHISVIVPDIPNISVIVPNIPNISLIVPDIPNISLIHNLPNFISVVGCQIPSIISLIGSLPSNISLIGSLPSNISLIGSSDIPSTITLDGATSIPNTISVINDIPETISVINDIPETISVINDITETISVIDDIPEIISVVDSITTTIDVDASALASASISLEVPTIDPIEVNWGSPPTLSCNVTINCDATSSTSATSMAMALLEADELEGIPLANLEVDYAVGGIPSRIEVESPEISSVKFDADSIPKNIKVKLDTTSLPSSIDVKGMYEIPSEINLNVPDNLSFPVLEVNANSLPESIAIDWGDIPTQINISSPEIPTTISVHHDIPSTISVEGMVDTISVEGFPDHIPLRLENPEDLSLRVEPTEVKITLDVDKLITEDEEGQHCFALVPCKK